MNADFNSPVVEFPRAQRVVDVLTSRWIDATHQQFAQVFARGLPKVIFGDFPGKGGHARVDSGREGSIVDVVLQQQRLRLGVDAPDQPERFHVVSLRVHAVDGPIVDDDDYALIEQALELTRLNANLWKSPVTGNAQHARGESTTRSFRTGSVFPHVDRRRVSAFAPVSTNDSDDFTGGNDAGRGRRRDGVRLLRRLRRQTAWTVRSLGRLRLFLLLRHCLRHKPRSRAHPLRFRKNLYRDQIAVDGSIHRRASAQQHRVARRLVQHVRLERVIPRRSKPTFDELTHRQSILHHVGVEILSEHTAGRRRRSALGSLGRAFVRNLRAASGNDQIHQTRLFRDRSDPFCHTHHVYSLLFRFPRVPAIVRHQRHAFARRRRNRAAIKRRRHANRPIVPIVRALPDHVLRVRLRVIFIAKHVKSLRFILTERSQSLVTRLALVPRLLHHRRAHHHVRHPTVRERVHLMQRDVGIDQNDHSLVSIPATRRSQSIRRRRRTSIPRLHRLVVVTDVHVVAKVPLATHFLHGATALGRFNKGFIRPPHRSFRRRSRASACAGRARAPSGDNPPPFLGQTGTHDGS